MTTQTADWQTGTITYKGESWASKDATGVDLMYAGPGGVVYYRGEPVLTPDNYHRINERIQARRQVAAKLDPMDLLRRLAEAAQPILAAGGAGQAIVPTDEQWAELDAATDEAGWYLDLMDERTGTR